MQRRGGRIAEGSDAARVTGSARIVTPRQTTNQGGRESRAAVYRGVPKVFLGHFWRLRGWAGLGLDGPLLHEDYYSWFGSIR